jgi:8-oxo-dGTP pyrophosphatase MutT (NUDIX family)
MIERHADISFAGGAVVFPGGRIDEGDRNSAWRDHNTGLEKADPDEHAPRIAAIREAFEETGILLARNEAGEMIGYERARALDPWRGEIEQDSTIFLELVRKEKLLLACDALHLFARWQPPKFAQHRRYHTWFFAAKTPKGQDAREDGNEATEVLWTTPQAVLDASNNSERKMIFPTMRNVELLNVSDSAEAVFDFAAHRQIELIEPRVVNRDGVSYLTIPDHLGYPVTEELVEKVFRK